MSDIFRKEYKSLTEAQKMQMSEIKNKAQDLWNFMEENSTPSNGRMMAIAKTNLEQSIMWAVKAITE